MATNEADREQHVPWPTHPDGTNKRMGDMTAEERRAQSQAAAARFAAKLVAPPEETQR